MRSKTQMTSIADRLEKAVDSMERVGISDYLDYKANKKRMLLSNLLSGIARGLGMAIGFTLLGAVVVYVLQRAAMARLPVIGDLIADIVSIVNSRLK